MLYYGLLAVLWATGIALWVWFVIRMKTEHPDKWRELGSPGRFLISLSDWDQTVVYRLLSIESPAVRAPMRLSTRRSADSASSKLLSEWRACRMAVSSFDRRSSTSEPR